MGDQIQAISSKVHQLNVYFWVGGGGREVYLTSGLCLIKVCLNYYLNVLIEAWMPSEKIV